jgi:excisionase family DNA binding protein
MGALPWNRDVNTSRCWYTVDEAAKYTGIDQETIRNEVRKGNLHTRRLNMKVVIVDAELERWVRVRSSPQVPAVPRPQIDPTVPRPFSVEDWLNQTAG